MKTNTEISFSFWLTLFYSIPSFSPYTQTDRQSNEFTHFAWAGGTCPRFAWAGGTFFPVVLLCQFLVLAGNRFWLYILLCTWSTIQLWCCVSFFGSGGEIVFGVTYVLSLQYSCAVVSFFVVVVGKSILYKYLTVTIVSQKYRELSL